MNTKKLIAGFLMVVCVATFAIGVMSANKPVPPSQQNVQATTQASKAKPSKAQ